MTDHGFAPAEQAHVLAIARRIASASDSRRRTVERILHDGVQQHLALLGLRLSILQRRIDTAPDEAGRMCDELRSELSEALAELRAVAHLIYPAVLENEGLGAALESAAQRIGVDTTVDSDDAHISLEVRRAFFFCCVEAIENAGRHAGPRARVEVTVRVAEGAARFEVLDDGGGCGDDVDVFQIGLQHVKDRIKALGGVFELTSTPQGTRVTGTVPLGA